MKCYAVITAGETAFFRARSDALLFIRARNDSNSRLEVQETTEQQLSAFALYDCTECINLPVAWLPSRDIQDFFRNLLYLCTHREYSCTGLRDADIFKISTVDFLDYMKMGKSGISPLDIVKSWIRQQDEVDLEQDMESGFERFLAETPVRVYSKDESAWKDIFCGIWKREMAARRYPDKKEPVFSDAEWQMIIRQCKIPDQRTTGKNIHARIRNRRIIIDADGCPVIGLTEKNARKYGFACYIFCDDTRVIHSRYSRVIQVPEGRNAADEAIISFCHNGDLVITQDFELAEKVMRKGAAAVHQNGWIYKKGFFNKSGKTERKSYMIHSFHRRCAEDDMNYEEILTEQLEREAGK